MSEEEEEQKKAPKQNEPKKGQRGRKRRTEPIVVTREDGTREEVSPQVYRRLRRWAYFCWQFDEVMLCLHGAHELSLVLILCMSVMDVPNGPSLAYRRVTNRLSARRMRQKRAEERETIAQEVSIRNASSSSKACKYHMAAPCTLMPVVSYSAHQVTFCHEHIPGLTVISEVCPADHKAAAGKHSLEGSHG